jgi:hypothetical protein
MAMVSIAVCVSERLATAVLLLHRVGNGEAAQVPVVALKGLPTVAPESRDSQLECI